MNWLYTALGTALILVGWHDVFHTLLNPSGRGRLSRFVMTGVWWMTKRFRRFGGAVGPTAIVLVALLWAMLQVVGWALVFFPNVPHGFAYAQNLDPGLYSPIAEAFYISLTTLTTLGYGDVVPSEQWMRVVAPLEALTGFALLSASASWFVQLHGALSRRRAFALRLTLLEEAGFGDDFDAADVASTTLLLESLAAQLAQTRIDYLQNSETYYFREPDPRASLAHALHYAWRLAAAAEEAPQAPVRMGGALLTAALHDLASCMKAEFIGGGDSTAAVFSLFADDHGGRRWTDDR